MSIEIQAPPPPTPTKATLRRSHQHTAEQIQWDIPRTIWQRDVPLIFGRIRSSRPDQAPHRITARLDGTNVSCSCEGRGGCTIEHDGWGVVASYWAQTYAEIVPEDLLRADRQYAADFTTCGLDQWQVLHWGICGDLICWRGLDLDTAA